MVCFDSLETLASHPPFLCQGSSHLSSSPLLPSVRETNGMRGELSSQPGHPQLPVAQLPFGQGKGTAVAGLVLREPFRPHPLSCPWPFSPRLPWPCSSWPTLYCAGTRSSWGPTHQLGLGACFLRSGSRHLPWRGRERVNYRCRRLIKAFDQDDGKRSL